MIGATIGVLTARACQHRSRCPRDSLDYTLVPGIAILCPPIEMAKQSSEQGIYLCEPLDSTSAVSMLLSEAMATFLFVSVILSVKYFHRGPDVLKAFAVGGCLLGMIYMIAGVSGASINPAVGLV